MKPEILQQLHDRWVNEGLTSHVGSGLSGNDICEYESINELILPAEYKVYIAEMNGFQCGIQDHEGFRFWPMSEVCFVEKCGIQQVFPNDGHARIVFADYMDLSWAYALDCVDGRVYMVGASSGVLELVADSFFDFIGYYLTGDERLYPA